MGGGGKSTTQMCGPTHRMIRLIESNAKCYLKNLTLPQVFICLRPLPLGGKSYS
jgi:hypothetical protein